MNVRGAASSGSPVNTDYSTQAQVDVGRKILAMDGLRPAFRTGPSPVAHNGRYWKPDRRRENAETVQYIRCLVQTCRTIKPWTATGSDEHAPLNASAKITMDQLPRVMQKVLLVIIIIIKTRPLGSIDYL